MHEHVTKLWPRVQRQPSGCWLFPYSIHNGYPRVHVPDGSRHGRMLAAHRVAWEMAAGEPMPAGWFCCHTCDHPLCVRNDDAGTHAVDGVAYRRFGHLFAAPNAVNIRDMFSKGRARVFGPRPVTVGANNPAAKLTPADVRAIRAAYTGRYGQQRRLAEQYGVDRETIFNITSGVSWSNV